MSDMSSLNNVVFQNPENKPLEDLKLEVHNNGISKAIPALDKCWIEKKYFLHYESPSFFDLEGKSIIGAKEQWVELVNYITDDLNWLINLPFYKFWSNIVYNPCIMDSLVTFLQEAPTFYSLDDFCDDEIKEIFNKVRKNILIVFARIMTNKESQSEFLSLSKHADLLYEKFIITIPIVIDLCQQYGRDNRKIIKKIVDSVFVSQPLYNQDLIKTVSFITKALTEIGRKFENNFTTQEGKAVLLSERDGANLEITLSSLEDVILYLLDIVSSISIFMDIYSPSIYKFKEENFLTKIVSVYGNLIPEVYKQLYNFAFKDETLAKYMELKHRLDVIRVEILKVYRTIVRKGIKDILEKSTTDQSNDIGDIIEDYLTNLIHTLCEKEFVLDYYSLYPIFEDFQVLLDIYPDLDTVKYQFIVDSIFTFLDEPKPSLFSATKKNTLQQNECAITSNHQSVQLVNELSMAGPSNTSKSEVEIASLISEVKDVLCDLGEGFIENCLKHYNYNKESVINAVLEDSLPNELKNLDHTLPIIPPDPEEASALIEAVTGVQRLNIYDNDEFDVMTKDSIDITKVHKGKRKDKYKNLNELLNDKSCISESKNLYDRYSIISNEYDDEYDDTYDDQDIGSSAQDDAVEEDARPFTIPRILRKPETNYLEDVEEEHFEYSTDYHVKRDNFVEDPAVLRAKAEERRISYQKNRSFNTQKKNLVGQPKGQGQTKEVIDNRNQKNRNKSQGANHNRRAGSQWKRSHGMVPS